MDKIIVAHRGGKEFEHENTLEAFEKAIEIGAKMVELDILQTKDGKIVCFHDSKVQFKKVSNITYKELLSLSGVKVPLFKDVLKLIKGQMLLLCEIKEKGYEEEALSLLKKHYFIEDVVIISYLDRVIYKMKKLDKKIQTGLIIGKKKFSAYIKDLFTFIRAKRCKADYLILNFHLINIGFAFLADILKIKVFTWTINNPEMMIKYFNNPHISGIITDRPQKASKLLTACSNGE